MLRVVSLVAWLVAHTHARSSGAPSCTYSSVPSRKATYASGATWTVTLASDQQCSQGVTKYESGSSYYVCIDRASGSADFKGLLAWARNSQGSTAVSDVGQVSPTDETKMQQKMGCDGSVTHRSSLSGLSYPVALEWDAPTTPGKGTITIRTILAASSSSHFPTTDLVLEEDIEYSSASMSADVQSDGSIKVTFTEAVEAAAGGDLGVTSFSLSLSSGPATLDSFSVAQGSSAAEWILTPSLTGTASNSQSQTYSLTLPSDTAIKAVSDGSFVRAPSKAVSLDLPVPVTFTASVEFDNRVKVEFSEAVIQAGGGEAEATTSDFTITVPGFTSASASLVSSLESKTFYFRIDLGTGSLPSGSESVQVNLAGDDVIVSQSGGDPVLAYASSINAGVLKAEIGIESAQISGNSVSFAFTGTVQPSGGALQPNATHFNVTATDTSNGKDAEVNVIVTRDQQQSNTYVVSIDPAVYDTDGSVAFTANILPGAMSATSGVPVAAMAEPAEGTTVARVGFTAALDERNRFRVEFTDDVSESGGSLSAASFVHEQLGHAPATGEELVQPANITGISVTQDPQNSKVYLVSVLTQTAASGRENVTLNIAPGTITGADYIPLRPLPQPIHAQLKADVVPQFSIDDANVVTMTFSGDVDDSTVGARDMSVEIVSGSTAALVDRQITTISSGRTYEIALDISGIILEADTVKVNLVLASVTDGVGRPVRALTAAAELDLAPTTAFTVVPVPDSMQFIVRFNRNVSSAIAAGTDISWSDFIATVEQSGSDAAFEFQISVAPGGAGSLAAGDAFLVSASVTSGSRTGSELIQFNVQQGALQDSTGAQVPAAIEDVDVTFPKPTKLVASLLPGNKVLMNFTRPVMLEASDLQLDLTNTTSNSIAGSTVNASMAHNPRVGAPGTADMWEVSIEYASAVVGTEIISVHIAEESVEDPVGGYIEPLQEATEIPLDAPTSFTILVLENNDVHVVFSAPVTPVGDSSGELSGDSFEVEVSGGTAVLDSVVATPSTDKDAQPNTRWTLKLNFGDTKLDGTEQISVNLKENAAADPAGEVVPPLPSAATATLNAPATVQFATTYDLKAVRVTFSRHVRNLNYSVLSPSEFTGTLAGGQATLRDISVELVSTDEDAEAAYIITPRFVGIPDGNEVFSLILNDAAIVDSLGFFVYVPEAAYELNIEAEDVFSIEVANDNSVRLQFPAPVYSVNASTLTGDSIRVSITGGTLTVAAGEGADPVIVTHEGDGVYMLDIPFNGYANGSETVMITLLADTTYLVSDDSLVVPPAEPKYARMYAPTRFAVEVQPDNSARVQFTRKVRSIESDGGPLTAENFFVQIQDQVSSDMFNVTDVQVAVLSGENTEEGSLWSLSFTADMRITSQYILVVRVTDMTVWDTRMVHVPQEPLRQDPVLNGEVTFSGSVIGHNEVRLSFTDSVRSTAGRALAPADFTLEIHNITEGSLLITNPPFEVEHLSASLNRVNLVPDLQGFATGNEYYVVNIADGALENNDGLGVTPDREPLQLQMRAQPQLEVSLNLRNEIVLRYTETVIDEMTSSALTKADFNVSVSGGTATLSDFSVEVSDGDGGFEGGREYTLVLELNGNIDGDEVVAANLALNSNAVSKATSLEAATLPTPFRYNLYVVTGVSFSIDAARVVTATFDSAVSIRGGEDLDNTAFLVSASGANGALPVHFSVEEVPGSQGTQWAVTPALTAMVAQGDQLFVNVVEGTISDARGVGVPAKSQSLQLDLTPSVRVEFETQGDNSIQATFSAPVRRRPAAGGSSASTTLVADDFDISLSGDVSLEAIVVTKQSDSVYRIVLQLGASATGQEQVTIGMKAGAVEDENGIAVLPQQDFTSLGRQPTVQVSLTVNNEVLYDFSGAMYGIPGGQQPGDDCFEVSVAGGAAESGQVTKLVSNSVLDSSNYVVRLSFSDSQLPTGVEQVTANVKANCIGTAAGLAVRPLAAPFNGTLIAPPVLESIEMEASGDVLFTLSASASRIKGAGPELEAYQVALTSKTGRVSGQQLVVVSPTQRRVYLTYSGQIYKGDTIAASLTGALAPLYDARGAEVVPLPAPVVLQVPATSTVQFAISEDNTITATFSRPVSRSNGEAVDGAAFSIDLVASAAFGPGGKTEPAAVLESVEVSAQQGGKTGASSVYVITPTFENRATGVETIRIRLASDTAIEDDRGMNVPRSAAATALNVTRDAVLDETFDGIVDFPAAQVVDLVQEELRMRWLAPNGVESTHVWIQLEMRHPTNTWMGLAVSPGGLMLSAGTGRAVVGLQNQTVPVLYDLVNLETMGKSAVQSSSQSAATSPLAAGQWYTGPPPAGTPADEDGFNMVLLFKLAVSPPDRSADGAPLELDDGAETRFIYAMGREADGKQGTGALGYHGGKGKGRVSVQLVPQETCEASSTCSGRGQCAYDLAMAANVTGEYLPERLACVCELGYGGSRCDECVYGFQTVDAVGDEGVMCLFPDVSSGVDFGDDDEAPVGIATLVFSLRLELDFDQMLLDEEGFTADFQRDVGESLGLSPDRILVRSLSRGSVVVDFAVLPTRNDTQDGYENIATELYRQVLDPTSALRTSGTIGAAVDPASLRIVEAIAPIPPTGLPTLENNEFRHRVRLNPGLQIRWFLSDALQPDTNDAATARRRPESAGETYLHARVVWDGEGEVPWFSVGFNTQGKGMIGTHAIVAWPGQLAANEKIREYVLTGKSGVQEGGVQRKAPAGDVIGVDVRERRDREGEWVLEFTRVLKPSSSVTAPSNATAPASAASTGMVSSDSPDLPASEDEGTLHLTWAYGSAGNKNIEGAGAYHGANRGSVKVDLSSGDVEFVPVSMLKKVHGVLMGVSWGILIPMSVFLIRFFDKDEARCGVVAMVFQLHRAVNALAVICSIVGLSLAFAAVEGPHFNYTHGVMGVITFALGIAQPINALLRPAGPASKTAERTTARIMWEVLHKSIGYIAMLIGFITILTGTVIITEQDGQDSSTAATAVGACIVIVVLAFVVAFAYVAFTAEPLTDAEMEEMAKAEAQQDEAANAAKQLRHTLGKDGTPTVTKAHTGRSEQAAAAAVLAASRAGRLDAAAGLNPLSMTNSRKKAVQRINSMHITPPSDDEDSGSEEEATGKEIREPTKYGGSGLTDNPTVASAAASAEQDESHYLVAKTKAASLGEAV